MAPLWFQAPILKGFNIFTTFTTNPLPGNHPWKPTTDVLKPRYRVGGWHWGYRGDTLKDSQGFQATAASKPRHGIRNTGWFLEILLNYCNPYMIAIIYSKSPGFWSMLKNNSAMYLKSTHIFFNIKIALAILIVLIGGLINERSSQYPFLKHNKPEKKRGLLWLLKLVDVPKLLQDPKQI